MKPKLCLVFGVLVLMLMATQGSPVGAAVAAATADSSMVGSSPAAFLCSLNVSTPAGGAIGQPAPLLKTAPPCGACSDFSCQGHSVGAVCPGTMGILWHCYDLSGTCSTDGNPKCSCRKNVP